MIFEVYESFVTKDELQTLLCEIEAVVNLRLLTYLGNVDDPQPLCPAAFLGTERVSEPHACYVELTADHLRKRAKYVEETRKHLEQRWKLEYVSTLSNYQQGQSRRLTKGDVVLLVDEQRKRQHWRLARVVELYAGHDGQCRVALVSCGGKDGFLQPVRKLMPWRFNMIRQSI